MWQFKKLKEKFGGSVKERTNDNGNYKYPGNQAYSKEREKEADKVKKNTKSAKK
jgi:hypothetical protein